MRPDVEIFLRILPVRDPEVVTIETVLIPVADDQGRLTRITAQREMVGHGAVPQ